MSVRRAVPARRRSVPVVALSARELSGSVGIAVPILAGVACLLALLGATISGPSIGQTLVVAVTLTALAALLATSGRLAVRAVPAVVTPDAPAGEVDAPTAYWCALEAPACPRRPPWHRSSA